MEHVWRTGAGASDAELWVVAYALIGLHRSLIAYVREGQRAGIPHATLARRVRTQASAALARLGNGFAGYGIRAD